MDSTLVMTHAPTSPHLGPSRRGCPKKAPDSQRIKARREKNRIAQREFRLRQQALEREQVNRSKSLEDAMGHILSIFLDVTDHATSSHWAQHDQEFMTMLRQSISNVLEAVRAVQDTKIEQKDQEHPTVRAAGDDGQTKQGRSFATDDALPRHDFEAGASSPPSSLFITQQASASAPTVETVPHDTIAYNGSIRNMFGNGWMGQMASYDLFSHHEVAPKPTLATTLTLQITYATLSRAYSTLLHARDLSEPRLVRAFGYRLRRQSRDEVLRSWRRRLSQGTVGLEHLATASVSQCTALVNMDACKGHEGVYQRGDAPITDVTTPAILEDLCNADELGTMLQRRIRGDSASEVLDVYMSPPQPLHLREDPSLREPKGVSPMRLTMFSDGEGMGGYQGSPATRLIRVSKSQLLDNLSTKAMCLGTGPLFPRFVLDAALLSSAFAQTRAVG